MGVMRFKNRDRVAPSAATSLSATVVSQTQITLGWGSASDNVALNYYNLYRDGALLTTLGPAVVSYDDTGLSVSSYSYALEAVDAAGNVGARASVHTAINPPSVSFSIDLHPHTAMVLHGGNRRYDTDTNYQTLAAKRHIVSSSAFRNWQSGKTLTFPQVIALVKAASTLAGALRWFNYQIMDEPLIADINASNAGSPWATKCNNEKWFLYTLGLTGTPLIWNGFADRYGANVTTYTAPDAAGKRAWEWFVDWIYSWQVTGDSGNAANSLLSGPYLDSVQERAKFAADWNIDNNTEGASNASTGNDPQGQWVRDGMAAYGAYQRTVWGSSKYIFANLAEYTALSRVTTGIEGQFHVGLMESFMGPAGTREYSSTAAQIFQSYTKIRDLLRSPKWVVWHHQTLSSTTGQDTESSARGDPNWQAARFGVCLSQLTDAYYWCSLDSNYRSEDAFETDEMTCGTAGPEALGLPTDTETTAMTVYQHISGAGSTTDDIYRRRFANGEMYVRPRASNNGAGAAVTTPVTVTFGGTRYRLRGIKETTVNNAQAVTSHTFSRDREAVMLMYSPT